MVVSALSKTDSQNVRPIFEWAKTYADEKEFIKKIYTSQFSSKEKIQKYEIINFIFNLLLVCQLPRK